MIRRHPTPREASDQRRPGFLRRFARSQVGSSTVEFVLLFPAIWMMFGATMEAGMYSMQQVMLERGLDMTVRDVRVGIMSEPTHAKLVISTCKYALILNDCEKNLRLEMIKVDPKNFTVPSKKVPCIDKVQTGIADVNIVNGKNNELMLLRVCVQIQPLLPLATVGRTLIENGTKAKYYPLSATTAYVMEPFQWNN